MRKRRFRAWVLISLLLLLAALPATGNAAKTDFTRVDAFVARQMDAMQIPGVALAVVRGDQIVYAKGYGRADSAGRPVDPGTPFVLGSLSKSFTAMAVLQLAEAGKIDLDAPLLRYLPAFRLAAADAAARITIRHLLNQTSGIPTTAGNAQLTGDEESSMAGVMESQAGLRLTAAPGERFQYSNYNYTLLGLAIQNVTGQTYEGYIREHIFSPLQMSHSHTDQAEARRDGLAEGHRLWFGFPAASALPYPRGSVSGGYLIATAEDMAHYLIAHLNGGRYAGTAVLSPQGINELHRPVAGTPGGGSYAMGWFAENLNGVPAVWHGGDTPNYHADMVLVPGEKLGIVMLTNRNTPAFSALFAKQVAADLTSMVVSGQAPARFFTLKVLYGLVDLAGLLIIWMQVRNLLRLRQQARPRWLRITRAVINIGVALLIGAGMPLSGGMTWQGMFLFHPDLSLLLAAGCCLSLVTGVGRLVRA